MTTLPHMQSSLFKIEPEKNGKIELSFSAPSLEQAHKLLADLKIHSEKASACVASILREPDNTAKKLNWDTDQDGNALTQRKVLLREKKATLKAYEDLRKEMNIAAVAYSKLSHAFDDWFAKKEKQVDDLGIQAKTVIMDLEEELHAHAYRGALKNIGFSGTTWKETEVLQSLARLGDETSSEVIWGKREVELTPRVRKLLYESFKSDFAEELASKKLAPLPVRILGLNHKNAAFDFVLPYILDVLSEKPWGEHNLQVFPALGLVYQAYNKTERLQEILKKEVELQFYLDKAWIFFEALVWQDDKLRTKLDLMRAERERKSIIENQKMVREKAEEAQRKMLLQREADLLKAKEPVKAEKEEAKEAEAPVAAETRMKAEAQDPVVAQTTPSS